MIVEARKSNYDSFIEECKIERSNDFYSLSSILNLTNQSKSKSDYIVNYILSISDACNYFSNTYIKYNLISKVVSPCKKFNRPYNDKEGFIQSISSETVPDIAIHRYVLFYILDLFESESTEATNQFKRIICGNSQNIVLHCQNFSTVFDNFYERYLDWMNYSRCNRYRMILSNKLTEKDMSTVYTTIGKDLNEDSLQYGDSMLTTKATNLMSRVYNCINDLKAPKEVMTEMVNKICENEKNNSDYYYHMKDRNNAKLIDPFTYLD